MLFAGLNLRPVCVCMRACVCAWAVPPQPVYLKGPSGAQRARRAPLAVPARNVREDQGEPCLPVCLSVLRVSAPLLRQPEAHASDLGHVALVEGLVERPSLAEHAESLREGRSALAERA